MVSVVAGMGDTIAIVATNYMKSLLKRSRILPTVRRRILILQIPKT